MIVDVEIDAGRPERRKDGLRRFRVCRRAGSTNTSVRRTPRSTRSWPTSRVIPVPNRRFDGGELKSGIEFHQRRARLVTTRVGSLVLRSSFREPHFGRFVEIVVVVGMEGFEPLVIAAEGDVEVAQAGLQLPLPCAFVDAAVAQQAGEAGVDAALRGTARSPCRRAALARTRDR